MLQPNATSDCGSHTGWESDEKAEKTQAKAEAPASLGSAVAVNSAVEDLSHMKVVDLKAAHGI